MHSFFYVFCMKLIYQQKLNNNFFSEEKNQKQKRLYVKLTNFVRSLIFRMQSLMEKKYYLKKDRTTAKKTSEREKGLNLFNIHYCVIWKSNEIPQTKAAEVARECFR